MTVGAFRCTVGHTVIGAASVWQNMTTLSCFWTKDNAQKTFFWGDIHVHKTHKWHFQWSWGAEKKCMWNSRNDCLKLCITKHVIFLCHCWQVPSRKQNDEGTNCWLRVVSLFVSGLMEGNLLKRFKRWLTLWCHLTCTFFRSILLLPTAPFLSRPPMFSIATVKNSNHDKSSDCSFCQWSIGNKCALRLEHWALGQDASVMDTASIQHTNRLLQGWLTSLMWFRQVRLANCGVKINNVAWLLPLSCSALALGTSKETEFSGWLQILFQGNSSCLLLLSFWTLQVRGRGVKGKVQHVRQWFFGGIPLIKPQGGLANCACWCLFTSNLPPLQSAIRQCLTHPHRVSM
mgnify:CR=1 FL=1